ncbi:MAG: hypothetical protein WC702_04275 [Patescibacteria group bacterium]|jgi:hypothetical protein
MKKIFCEKNKTTKIISNFGRGYPQMFNITITSKNNEKVSGKYSEKRYLWIFPQTPIEGNLKETMQFQRYWINGIYSVSITPNCDVEVQIK